MSLYKLTKGSLSIIRSSAPDAMAAIAAGFALDGEVVEEGGAYRVVNPAPQLFADKGGDTVAIPPVQDKRADEMATAKPATKKPSKS